MADLVTRLRVLLRPSGPPSADADLLTRFVELNDQDAFSELVRRHGPMVYGVCRRAVGDGPDAEDAYQAAFLVLARRAAAVAGMRSVSGWLYGVACLTAKKARARRARRRMREGGPLPDVPAPSQTVEPDLGTTIDEELTAVPERYRTAVVLCELRQLTLDEAAGELGVPRGTVASRLARGRELLGKRLLRRGLLTAGVGSTSTAFASVPVQLDARVVEVATNPNSVHELSTEVLRTMSASTRIRAVGLMAAAIAIAGVPLLLPPTHAAPIPKAEVKAKPVLDRVKVVGIGGLLEQPTARKSLHLSQAQDKRVEEIKKETVAAMKAVRKAHAANANPTTGTLQDVQDKLSDALAESDTKLVGVFDAAQMNRLRQIHLQRDGASALLSRYAVRELALTADQEDKMADELVKLQQPKAPDLLVQNAFWEKPTPDIAKLIERRAAALDEVRDNMRKHLTEHQREKWDELLGEKVPAVELFKGSIEVFWHLMSFESHKP